MRGAGGVAGPLEDAREAPEANGAGAGSDAEAPAASSGGSGGGDRSGRGRTVSPSSPPARETSEAPLPAAAPRESRQPLPRRAVGFLRGSWAELQRVQWPDRRHVAQATAVVLGFVVVAGLYLGAADWVAQKIVNFIL